MRTGVVSREARLGKRTLIALILALSSHCWASPKTFSLSGDWSNTTNPNGPWSYRQGNSALPKVADWTADGTAYAGCNQPAWAPSNTSGNFLPAFVKANSCTADALDAWSNGVHNVLPGDIVVHTVDSANGNPSKGVANVLFKLPSGDSDRYQISGFIWDAATILGTERPQDWVLLINGVKKASGKLSGDLPRSQAQKFSITANLMAGDTVEVELAEDPDSQFGFFVGVSMTIQPVQPVCALTDVPTYDATKGMLTMKFTIETPAAAKWNAWLVVHNSVDFLWSQAQSATSSTPVVKLETHDIGKSGEIGILSTLTTPTGGITCSSWETISTGTP